MAGDSTGRQDGVYRSVDGTAEPAPLSLQQDRCTTILLQRSFGAAQQRSRATRGGGQRLRPRARPGADLAQAREQQHPAPGSATCRQDLAAASGEGDGRPTRRPSGLRQRRRSQPRDRLHRVDLAVQRPSILDTERAYRAMRWRRMDTWSWMRDGTCFGPRFCEITGGHACCHE